MFQTAADPANELCASAIHQRMRQRRSVRRASHGLRGYKSALQRAARLSAGAAVSSLEAAGNKLQAVPAARLANLTSLAHLDLCRNPLRSWPLPTAPPGCLPHLSAVLLACNRDLPCLPAGAFAACCGALTRLDLSGAPLQPLCAPLATPAAPPRPLQASRGPHLCSARRP